MSYLDGEFLGDVIADNDDAYRYLTSLIKTNKINQYLPLSEFNFFRTNAQSVKVQFTAIYK